MVNIMSMTKDMKSTEKQAKFAPRLLGWKIE